MSSDKFDIQKLYSIRRRKFLNKVKGEAALIVANPLTYSSNDVENPYRPNTDLFYLTGMDEPFSILVLRGIKTGPRSVLFIRDKDPLSEKWSGKRIGIKAMKRKSLIDEIRPIEDFTKDFPELIQEANKLHYNPGLDQEIDNFIWSIFKNQSNFKTKLNGIENSKLITAEMRFIKDKYEVQCLKHAAEISAEGLKELLGNVKLAKSELHCAKMLETSFARMGSTQTAFNTIIASGKNATTLHHSPSRQPIWRRDLLLIDAGASYQGYAGDISRTIPASGKFTSTQAEVYDIVLSALEACINKAKPEGSLKEIHKIAVRSLTKGLIDLGILKGELNELVKDGAYRDYYMHGTGHWLGLDVHDISPVSFNDAGKRVEAIERKLVPGNAFTIEPGLYFDPNDKKIPAEYRGIGIRIEEDILITPKGCQVLTERMPRDRESIEALMA